MPAAAKPSVINEWRAAETIPDGPDNTAQASGFEAQKRVPFNWLDWDWWLDGKWQAYLRDVFPFANFGNIGESLLNDLAEALTERFIVPMAPAATSTRTAVMRLGVGVLGAVGKSIIVYTYSTDDLGRVFEIALNAYWDGSDWKRSHVGSIDSAILRVGFDAGYRLAWRDDGASDTWADSYAGTAGGGTGWTSVFNIAAGGGSTTIATPLVVSQAASFSDDVGVGGDLTGALGGTLNIGSDIAVGDDATVTDDLTVGDDVSVAGDITATGGIQSTTGTIHGVALYADQDLTVNGSSTLGNSTGDTVTCAGRITAAAGLRSAEHLFAFNDYTGPGGTAIGDAMYLAALSGVAGSTFSKKLFRPRGGELRRLTIWTSAAPASGQPLQVHVYKTNGGTDLQIASLTLINPDTEQLGSADITSADYDAGDYLSVRLSTGGSGGSQSAFKVIVVLDLVE